MLTAQQQGVILLIKSALTGEKYSLPEDFDLKSAFNLTKKHGIGSMFYYGAINCGLEEDNPVLQDAFLMTCAMISRNAKQIFEIEKLFEKFDESKIEYMPLKGTLLKDMYPKSEMRVMADADILIKTAQYNQIKSIMLDLGYEEKAVTDHELQWLRPSLYVELHSRLIPSYNKDYYDYYGDGWQLAKLCDGTRYSMTDEDQMIYLFTHFAKHYRDAGIGLKHIVDLWIYRNNKSTLDEEYIKNELKKLQLDKFYLNIIETLEVWFKGKSSSEITDFVTDYIFECGAAGSKENYIVSDMLKNSKTISAGKSSKFKRYWYYIFFPYTKMCMKYPFLKKFPIALPIMWVVRWISALMDKNKIASVNAVVNEVSDDQILDRQRSLNFVGLDFNFKE